MSFSLPFISLTVLCGEAAEQENWLTAIPVSYKTLFHYGTKILHSLLPLERPFTVLFIKSHISGGRRAEAGMEADAGGTVVEIESRRTGLHVLRAAALDAVGVWGGVEPKLCLTPCQADRPP